MAGVKVHDAGLIVVVVYIRNKMNTTFCIHSFNFPFFVNIFLSEVILVVFYLFCNHNIFKNLQVLTISRLNLLLLPPPSVIFKTQDRVSEEMEEFQRSRESVRSMFRK